MTDIVKGMAEAHWKAWLGPAWPGQDRAMNDTDIATMRAALLWLADNVSDEMVQAYEKFLQRDSGVNTRKDAIALAIRAAAGGEQ